MRSPRKRVAILGSTGSIGRSALQVAHSHPDAFEIVSLSARENVRLLGEQAEQFGVRRVAVGEGRSAGADFPPGVEVAEGPDALEALASDPGADLVLNALVGAAGLLPTLAALRAGKRVALANKESLVMAGELVMREARDSGGELIPVDSEHSSIFRCIGNARSDEVERIVLTASGGPLRDLPAEAIATAAVSEVLSHPTWSMGDKVTVDSATLVNKAMEVVEARWLFDLPYDRIDVVLHRESIVHGLVTLSDGTLLAHLAAPDMRLPIQYAMFHPDRGQNSFGDCAPAELGTLHFTPVDYGRYPCFGLVLEAAKRGGTAPAIAAAADEIAVAAFTEGRIRFGDIADVIGETVSEVAPGEAPDVESILAAGEQATAFAGRVIDRRKTKES